MALWLTLHINDQRLGSMEVRRREDLDLTDQAGIRDAISTYDVRRNGRVVGTVQHRYGDGAWRLLALAADLIAQEDTP